MTEMLNAFEAYAKVAGLSSAALKASWMRQGVNALAEFALQEVTQRGRTQVIHNAMRKRVVVAFSGLKTKPSIMMPFLQHISGACEADVVAYPGKMPLRTSERLAVWDWGRSEIQNALRQQIQVAVIGWSAGGRMANLLGHEFAVPSVCVFTSQFPQQMFGGQVLQCIAREKFSEETIPKNGNAVVEEFSLTNRKDTWNRDSRVITLEGIHNHLAINHASTCSCVAELLKEAFAAQSD